MKITELESFAQWLLDTYKIYETYEEEDEMGDLETYYERVNLTAEKIVTNYLKNKGEL